MGKSDRPMISVVDDDESLRRSLSNLLRSVGFGVETFASADEFLRSAQRENTGCLVLDLQMPGMSGLDLLRQLAFRDSRIRVVILTAHGDEETRRRSLQAAAGGSLHKPLHRKAPPAAATAALRCGGGHAASRG